MSSFLWPSDEGWPYPDTVGETVDLDATTDDETLCMRASPSQVFAHLDPLERAVITAHYGLEGQQPRTMKQLHAEMGLPRAELRDALGAGLAKLRTELQ
jgi:DNA-directed RNA polymerase sigma subunit (sigma70/sigma32)